MKKESLELIEQIHFKDEKQKAVFTLCEELSDIPYRTLAGIANSLNVWEWPPELLGKPEGWEKMSFEEKREWIDPALETINIKVGQKAISRYSATVENGMTDKEFEDWWDSRFKKDLQELLDEIYKNDHEGSAGDTKRNDRNGFVLTICSFVFGFITAFLIFGFIR